MSTLDKQPRINSGLNDALHERRVDPGTNANPPKRVNGPSLLATKIPRGQDNTKAPKRMPVKR